jgi:hypothetical protein
LSPNGIPRYNQLCLILQDLLIVSIPALNVLRPDIFPLSL